MGETLGGILDIRARRPALGVEGNPARGSGRNDCRPRKCRRRNFPANARMVLFEAARGVRKKPPSSCERERVETIQTHSLTLVATSKFVQTAAASAPGARG